MENNKVKVPVWFRIVAILFLLWNIMGLFSFFSMTFISDEALSALPENERALYGEYPAWTKVLFAIAVAGGFLASLGVLFRKRWAMILAVISLIAVVIQMIHNVFFTSSIDVYGFAQAVTMPILVVIFGVFLIWFISFGIKKHWLK